MSLRLFGILLGAGRCFRGEWVRNDFIKIYSEEAERDDSISMDDFNKVVDYFINAGYDFLTKEELFNAIDNNTKLA